MGRLVRAHGGAGDTICSKKNCPPQLISGFNVFVSIVLRSHRLTSIDQPCLLSSQHHFILTFFGNNTQNKPQQQRCLKKE